MRTALPLLLLAITLLASSPHAPAQGQDFTMLHIQDYRYLPDPLEVTPGLTVVVMSFPDTNKTAEETEPHTVTDVADPPRFDVRNIPPDASQHPFTAPMEPGTYPYFCRYHGDRQGSGMVGTLVVTAAGSTNASPTSTVTLTPSATPSPASQDETPFVGLLLTLVGVAAPALLRPRRSR